MIMIGKIAIALLLLAGCGNFERGNPCDSANPASGQECNPAELLIGTWSREDAEKNEVYTFKSKNSVELSNYSSPDGGEVDRNASYPQTLVLRYTGIYSLLGNLLRISFAASDTNEPGGLKPSLPSADKVVEIVVERDELILKERDGDRIYTRI